MLIDTHAHIDFGDFENVEEIIENAQKAGVKKIIIPGVESSGFDRIMQLVDKYPCVYGMLGVHPNEARQYNDETGNIISALAKHPKIVGIGEVGLDYYWDKSFADIQKEVFIKQIEIANKLQKTIVVHNRDAHADCFDILKKHRRPEINVVMHCFSGSVEFAEMCVKEGHYIALGGVVTFKNAKVPKHVAQTISLENLLLETDAPFLTPEPYRGKRNEPAYVKYVAEEIARLREVSCDEIAKITTENAIKAFQMENGKWKMEN